MKVKLNLALRKALISCYALAAPVATTICTGGAFVGGALAYTMTIPAQAATYTATGDTDDDGGVILFDTATADDTVIMQMDDENGTKFWWNTAPSDYICDAGTIQINSWKMTDGSSNKSWTFNSTITGDGDIEFIPWTTSSSTTNNNLFTFTGDMSAWTGDVIALANSSGAYGLSVAVTGETSTAASGTGSITIEGSDEYLEYSFTGAATIANKAITVSNLYFNGGGSYTVNSPLVVSGTTSIAADTDVVLNGANSITALSMGSGSSLEVALDASLDISGAYSFSDDTSIVNYGQITFSEGAQLDISDITFSINDDGSYSATLISGTGSISYGDLALSDIFTADSLSNKASYSFADGVFTFSYDDSSLVYSDGGTLDLGVGTSVGGLSYSDDYPVVINTSNTTLNLTTDIAATRLEVNNAISLTVTSSNDSVLNSGNIVIGSGSTMVIMGDILGDDASFSGSSSDSTLQFVLSPVKPLST